MLSFTPPCCRGETLLLSDSWNLGAEFKLITNINKSATYSYVTHITVVFTAHKLFISIRLHITQKLRKINTCLYPFLIL